MRTGVSDVARGVQPISGGKHRITYKIESAGSSKGYGIVLGVTDAEAFTWKDVKFALGGYVSLGSGGKKPASRPIAAWGVSPSLGRFIETPDAAVGQFGGASVLRDDLTSFIQPCTKAEGLTVFFEIDVPQHEPHDSHIVKRDFQANLHPLTISRRYPLHLEPMQTQGMAPCIARRGSMAFSINGGEMIQVNVALPPALWPWVHLSWEDRVTLVKVEKLPDPTSDE